MRGKWKKTRERNEGKREKGRKEIAKIGKKEEGGPKMMEEKYGKERLGNVSITEEL